MELGFPLGAVASLQLRYLFSAAAFAAALRTACHAMRFACLALPCPHFVRSPALPMVQCAPFLVVVGGNTHREEEEREINQHVHKDAAKENTSKFSAGQIACN